MSKIKRAQEKAASEVRTLLGMGGKLYAQKSYFRYPYSALKDPRNSLILSMLQLTQSFSMAVMNFLTGSGVNKACSANLYRTGTHDKIFQHILCGFYTPKSNHGDSHRL